jgi:hypothetical protein
MDGEAGTILTCSAPYLRKGITFRKTKTKKDQRPWRDRTLSMFTWERACGSGGLFWG